MLGVNTKMLFITAGMGGGTGTGASPVLAKAAKELGILTVAIVTTPFTFEGKRRRTQAEEGLEELKKYVDSYLVISNDRLREIFGNLTMGAAFSKADDILSTAAKGIAEIITIPGYVNVDFKDVRTVMNDSGVAIMGSDKAEGEDRARKAVEGALASPLLKDSEIEGARYILLNITSGKLEVTMDEVTVITDYIQNKAGMTADLIWGNCIDESLENHISVTIIATGFQTSEERIQEKDNKRIEIPLEDTPLIRPLNEPVEAKNSLRNEVLLKEEENSETLEKEFKPVDLFSEFPRNEKNKIKNTGAQVIKHSLVDEKEQMEEDENQTDHETYTLREAENEINFGIPTYNHVEVDTPQTGQELVEEAEMEFNPDENKTDESIEEQLRKAKERILRLRDLGIKLRSASGLQEIESEPAYKRKQMALDNIPHSSESQISRFTLSKDDESTEIRPNNTFLHDNVD
jgi:cell division protein FtsZ